MTLLVFNDGMISGVTKMNKAIIIGAGKTTRNLTEYVKELGYEFSDCFSICLDNDSSLWGMKIDGVMIDAVERVKNYLNTEIVISSIYEKDIRRQLESLNVQGHIINYTDYKRKLMVDYQISKYNIAHPVKLEKKTEDIQELTVYTAIIGGYDFLREITVFDKNIKYICFTDDMSLRSDTWEIRYVDREFSDPIIESRKYKMLPHLFVDTKYSLYVDANIQLNRSPIEYMVQYFNRGNMLLLPHYARDCIYREMAACILGGKDCPQSLLKQTNIYSECGCPEHSGLFLGGMIGRRHFEKEIIKFDEEWWEHFLMYSKRDQISLGYLIWKKDITLSLADINFCNNIWFTVDGAHK